MTTHQAISRILGDLYHLGDDPELLRQVQSDAFVKSFEKGTIIQKNGDRQNYAAFLINGVVRASFIAGNGEELTDSFLCDFGYPVMTPDVNRPLFLTTEAVNQVDLLMMPMAKLFDLMKDNVKILWAYNQMLNWALFFHWQIKTNRVCYNGTERYAWFLKTFPEADRVAMGKHIASFLGITPESLSRIRNNYTSTDVFPIMIELKTEQTSDGLYRKMKNGFQAGKVDV